MSADNWTDCPKCGADDELREDYEIGFWQGKFSVSYRGDCQSCDFLYEYTYKADDNFEAKLSGSKP